MLRITFILSLKQNNQIPIYCCLRYSSQTQLLSSFTLPFGAFLTTPDERIVVFLMFGGISLIPSQVLLAIKSNRIHFPAAEDCKNGHIIYTHAL